MQLIKTVGIVLNERMSGESDKIITLLTPDIGKIQCIAKGARKVKSKLLAGTSLLAYSKFVLFKGQTMYKVNEAELIEVFYDIRNDVEKLECASFFIKVVNDVTHENQWTYKILQLMLNALYILSLEEQEHSVKFIKAVFTIKLLELLGFCPYLKKCFVCGQDVTKGKFSVVDGCIKCYECAKIDKSAIEIFSPTIHALRYITSVDAKKIFSFNLEENFERELEIIADAYLTYKLEKKY